MSHYILSHLLYSFFFFFNDTATTEIYTLSLHDALPISTINRMNTERYVGDSKLHEMVEIAMQEDWEVCVAHMERSEEHTSELQSQFHLVCRLLLEKKKRIRRSQAL